RLPGARAPATTRAPRAASASATARPTPRDAPVTNARDPSSAPPTARSGCLLVVQVLPRGVGRLVDEVGPGGTHRALLVGPGDARDVRGHVQGVLPGHEVARHRRLGDADPPQHQAGELLLAHAHLAAGAERVIQV